MHAHRGQNVASGAVPQKLSILLILLVGFCFWDRALTETKDSLISTCCLDQLTSEPQGFTCFHFPAGILIVCYHSMTFTPGIQLKGSRLKGEYFIDWVISSVLFCGLIFFLKKCVAKAGLDLVILLPPSLSANFTGVSHHNQSVWWSSVCPFKLLIDCASNFTIYLSNSVTNLLSFIFWIKLCISLNRGIYPIFFLPRT